MSIPNNINFVPRERVSGHIEGVDYGYNMFCIARSPEALLLWSAGTAYTSGRQTRYGASSLELLDRASSPDRQKSLGRIGDDGGRLTAARIWAVKDVLENLFGAGKAEHIAYAVKTRQTVLFDGGGGALQPCRTLGAEAYRLWRDVPTNGYYNNMKGRQR